MDGDQCQTVHNSKFGSRPDKNGGHTWNHMEKLGVLQCPKGMFMTSWEVKSMGRKKEEYIEANCCPLNVTLSTAFPSSDKPSKS